MIPSPPRAPAPLLSLHATLHATPLATLHATLHATPLATLHAALQEAVKQYLVAGGSVQVRVRESR